MKYYQLLSFLEKYLENYILPKMPKNHYEGTGFLFENSKKMDFSRFNVFSSTGNGGPESFYRTPSTLLEIWHGILKMAPAVVA